MSEPNWKPRTGQKIISIYAWVAEEADGGEGVVAGHSPEYGAVPLIGADRDRIESFRGVAEVVSRQTGCPVRLKMFSGGAVIDEIHRDDSALRKHGADELQRDD